MELLAILKDNNYLENEIEDVESAIKFAKDRNINVDHNIDIAKSVIREIDLGVDSIIAIILQNVYENVEYVPEIEKKCNKVTLKIIKGLNKIPKVKQKTSQIETDEFRNLLISLVEDIRVILIKIIENYHLITTLTDKDELIEVSNEAKYIFAPLAHRLGLYKIKTQLEDFSLKNLQPVLYQDIAKKINIKKQERDEYIERFVELIKSKLKGKIDKFEIKWRTKSIASIYNKLMKSNIEFEDIFDLYAARIIIDTEVEEKSECWKAYSIVTDLYQPNPARLRDWLSIPKTNGYESLHTTVLADDNKWIEVQIRSKRMNEIAEKGLAAHWKYKGGTEQQLDSLINNVREILESPVSSSKELINELRYDNLDNEIYIFTPKGELKTLKAKSTVLDFAYTVHSKVGSSCIGAKIKNRIVPIKYVLENGDQVEIITSKTQKPKADWLNFTVTSKARAKIKNELNLVKLNASRIGKEMVLRRFKNWKVEFSDELIHEIVKEFNFKNTVDFFYSISINKFDVLKLKQFFDDKKTDVQESKKGVVSTYSAEEFNFKNDPTGDVLVIGDNLSHIDYSFSKCCNPVFGDAVFGFTTITKGIRIHRNSCPNAAEMKSKFSYRIIDVNWSTEDDKLKYQTTVKITGDDQIGIIGTITATIQKEENITIRSMNLNSQDGAFEAIITCFVKNTNEIKSLCNKLQTLKGISKVERLGK